MIQQSKPKKCVTLQKKAAGRLVAGAKRAGGKSGQQEHHIS